ncbi:eukaryotic membrane protein family-domain-containing protein [Phaeosphaeriaceae sp. PMI808]|nr:eukaryotic membrane protein family-domain-containing protein [Phaeosphaeriaceae sp. PMI808]
MNGADTRTRGETRATEQLPTPALSPAPDDVAFPTDHRSNDATMAKAMQDITNTYRAEMSRSLSASSNSRRTSVHEDAIMSDASEKIRPIKRPGDGRRKSSVSEQDKVLKLSSRQMQELTNEPASIPIRTATPILEDDREVEIPNGNINVEDGRVLGIVLERPVEVNGTGRNASPSREKKTELIVIKSPVPDMRHGRPQLSSHASSKPARKEGREIRDLFSPMRAALPLPPMSIPTFLSLELAANRPSPLYIYRASNEDFPYESSELKYQRLINFMKIPAKIEGILGFGALACLDAWMHTLTILPLRFLLAIGILVKWWGSVIIKEVRDIWAFVFNGLPRVWRRRRQTDGSHKADILKGLLIASSCFVLMRFDASRMYHSIRGQSAIKLYVIYNLLEVCDRLLSAIGQDVLECLFSRETLDRNPDGRSKVLRPFGMFVLALVYAVAHATALFYQVVTLNVAVNSYSNALLTLLMSNQFVEIKGTVFKKFEKENLFQITCADIVERFQLWFMLLIIAMRNVVEVGGLSIRSSDVSWTAMFTSSGNATTSASAAAFTASSILPMSFTIFPKYIAQVLNPFLLVLGSEMVVDWLKHAYITKFNQYKPEVYDKFFDVLAKDYYSNAFTDPNLTKRLGLPVIPLSCLFIRAAIQTYHMFVAMYMPPPLPASSTSLTSDPASSPASTAAFAHIDQVFRRALGHSSFGAGVPSQSWYHFSSWTLDDLIAGSTMLIVFLVIYLIFLAFKLILGMLLLIVARKRYHGMQEREMMNTETGGKWIGGWGVVDVDEEKRRHIYDDDSETLKRLRERDEKAKKKGDYERERGTSFGHVSRYAMVAKRIW